MPLSVDGWGETGGDNEPPILLNKLARRHPDVEFVIVGRNSGEAPTSVGLPANVTNGWNKDRFQAVRDIRAKHKSITNPHERLIAISHDLVTITADLFANIDQMVLWLGQHGSSNHPIPTVSDPSKLTQPQDAFVNYAGFIIQGLNAWRDVDPIGRKEVWLCADNRNYLKGRDVKWPPPPVLGQYDWEKTEKQFRYGDTMKPADFNNNIDAHAHASVSSENIWSCTHKYVYSGLEVVGIPSNTTCSYEWEGRGKFGILINEARSYVTVNRLDIMKEWVMPLEPDWIHGTWPDESQRALGRGITPLPWTEIWDKVRTVRSTFTTPSSGSGWATTKPWEAFAVGTVCFFHPKYDDQGHVIPTSAQVDRGEVDDDPELRQLALWLRPDTPEQLAKRVNVVNEDRDAWLWLVQAQRRHFEKMMEDNRCIQMIEERTGLITSSSSLAGVALA